MAFTGKLSMPFMPSDGYVSRQNPPDFTWGLVDGAEAYELEVSIDEKFENIAYKVKAPYNFHNFDRIFKTGIKYWWRVRYIKDGKPSEFSAPRRFRIDPRAYEFPVPDIDTLMK